MLDHIGLTVADMERARAFYQSALKPLGVDAVMEVTADETGGDAHAGFGKDGKPFFWIGTGAKPMGGTHVAFAAGTRAEVDAFYRAALAAGGRDNGAPGRAGPPAPAPRPARGRRRGGVHGGRVRRCGGRAAREARGRRSLSRVN